MENRIEGEGERKKVLLPTDYKKDKGYAINKKPSRSKSGLIPRKKLG